MADQWAVDAVDAIIADLTGRRGIGDEFEGIDEGIQQEIKDAWAEIITEKAKR